MSEACQLAFLVREFAARFGRCRAFSAPGRVNLIGEHTDYNDGFVLPIAIDRRTYVVGAPRLDRTVNVRSADTSSEFGFRLDEPGARRRGAWVDYVEGTAQEMCARGFALAGADLLLSSDIPRGAGLSSSAALEMSVGYALARLSGVAEPDLIQLALSGQAAENDWVGARVGIMDQFITARAERGSALLIDCRSLQTTSVPLELGSACLLICDTRVKHQLASSAYNERREQCEHGVALLRSSLPDIQKLRDLNAEQLARYGGQLPELIRRRCRHVVSENERTLNAARALSEGRWQELGELMVTSHESLRDDYEVSSLELDAAVASACAQAGVYGARMTGGGFGGCTITLLERAAVERVSEAIRSRLEQQFARTPDLFLSDACQGVREHEL
ncbi:MAG TPA: galactokinase [Polyangiaceae bacterium]|nr:galactokinase [Polyangiaceae bacterium]